MVRHPIRILGIDPGLRRTGWGLIETDGNRLIHVACGSLETSDRAALGERLVAIHDGLMAVIERFAPQEAAVEQTFVNTNAAATLKLGQARGIAMLVPARAGLRVAEYAPNVVKKTVVGAGHGEKAQIRMMIGVLLPKATPQSDDAADALAIAVCHAHHRTSVMRPELPPPERGRVGVGVNDDCERPSPGRFAVDLPLAGGGKQKSRLR